MKQKRKTRSLLAALLAAVLLMAALPLSAYAAEVSLEVVLDTYSSFSDAVAALSNPPDLNTVTALTIKGGLGIWRSTDGSYLLDNFPALETLDMEGFTGTYDSWSLALNTNQSTKIRRVRLPANVAIPNQMFADPAYGFPNTSLTTLVCGDRTWQDGVIDLTSAASYEANAFDSCTAITQVRLPADIDISNGDNMFARCTGLKTLVCGSGDFKQGVVDLTGYTGSAYGKGLFNGCSAIKQVRLPDNIDVSEGMFKSCAGLKELTFVGNSSTAPKVGTDAFLNVPTGGTLSYPAGAAGYDTLAADAGLTGWLGGNGNVDPVVPPTPAAPAAEGTPHVCDFGGWQYSNEHHWKSCSCTALSDYAPHVFNSARVCTVCGYGAKPKKFNPPTGVYDSSLPRFA